MSKVKEAIRTVLPRAIGARRILQGPLAGFKIVTSWHDYPGAILGTTERPLLKWFDGSAKSGETWIDIGAHYGYTSLALARLVGASGRVFAFEPVLKSAGCLGSTRELNRQGHIRIVPMGLSRSTTLQAHSIGVVRGMADSSQSGGEWNETIYTMSFDSLWASIDEGKADIQGVKIDVQGMELEVLAGMRESLLRWRPHLVVEFHEGVNRDVAKATLAACGYQQIGRAIEQEGHPLTDEFLDNKSYAFSAEA